MFSSLRTPAPAPLPAQDVTLVPLSARAKVLGTSAGSLARQARRGQIEGAQMIASRWYVPDPAPAVTAVASEVPTDPGLALPALAQPAQQVPSGTSSAPQVPPGPQ